MNVDEPGLGLGHETAEGLGRDFDVSPEATGARIAPMIKVIMFVLGCLACGIAAAGISNASESYLADDAVSCEPVSVRKLPAS
jgi:hypothetical protein